MKKPIKQMIHRMMVTQSAFNMSLASSLGVLVGMLPLVGIKIPLLVVLSLALRLNIFALLGGALIPLVLPILHLWTYQLYAHMSGHIVPAFNLRMLSLQYLLSAPDASTGLQFLSALLVGLGLGLLSFPLFKWFYSWRINFDRESAHYNFVFYDGSGTRWRLAKRMMVIFMGGAIAITAVFGLSISVNPYLPLLGLKSPKELNHISALPLSLDKHSKVYLLTHPKQARSPQIDYHKGHFKRTATASQNPLQGQSVYAFYVNWDENSKASLKAHVKDINVLLPNWYTLNKDGSFKREQEADVDAIAKAYHIKLMPVVNNYINNQWDADFIHVLGKDQARQTKFINGLVQDAKQAGYYGINLDFESIKPEDKQAYTALVKQLGAALHANGLKLSLDVPPNSPEFDYKVLSSEADTLIVMMYDEHYQTGTAGPIASQNWFEANLDQQIPASKMIVAVGSYGYDWNVSGGGPADAVTYGDILSMVDENDLQIQWDKTSENPYMTYREADEDHVVWLLDGVTVYNEIHAARAKGIAGTALWRLGSEDPTVWEALNSRAKSSQVVDNLKKLSSPEPVHYSGAGEVLKILSEGSKGEREVTLDSNHSGEINNETYVKYPRAFEVERYGKPKTKSVVLTFDDGPDPNYTPKILDILKRYNVKGAFFVVGENAAANPDLIKRIYNEGHELGNHTFTHPNIAETSNTWTKIELNTTQRLIQELTGHAMIMFRPPYVADAEPSTPEELLPILRAQEQGYMMIGELIDPNDWQKPSSSEIVNRILKEVDQGNLILLHDAGGDRSHTVEALPKVIETLKKEGYTFTTIHDLLGKNRADLMPSVDAKDNSFIQADQALFAAAFDWTYFVSGLFYLAIVLGMIRIAFLVVLSWLQKRKDEAMIFIGTEMPLVSVVIAAYNEETVILRTIESVLKSAYSNLEILVIDDGSKDRTAQVVSDAFGKHPQVKLIQKTNGGKSSAVNLGYREASGVIVVGIDADTLLAPEAIGNMIRHFSDAEVAAVSGNVKVGNVHNLLTLWQHVEYVTGFNLEKRAFAFLNCITVVPGAIGAWRKDVVASVGYLSEDTLAEDTDLTLSILRKGYKIAYEEKAYAYTESPADLKSLIKQRFRWSYGTLQCLWKHREALFDMKLKALGFIGLPNMWIFQYIFQSLSPIADIYFVLGLMGKAPEKVVIFYVAFLILDYMAAIYAFRLEKVNLKALLGLFVQRVLYRLIMAYVVMKSLVAAFKGIMVGWNKLQRQGNVKL